MPLGGTMKSMTRVFKTRHFQRWMRKTELTEPQDYDAAKVKALRERLNLSQAVLASVLNTSTSTVRKWEVGDKHPSGPSQKLLDILERKGL